ncbi:LGFP repeat-containing protein [Mycobacterium sp.]|uniref:LGFP repeat-containing protein n=1 Tax=Mycobacterium sp. TaxID=1785 RepID=UPI003BAC19FD
MNAQRGQLSKVVGRTLLSLATIAAAAVLLAPAASASPASEAEAAITAEWKAAGGTSSPLGAKVGDVYPIGEGFAQDFDDGKMLYTTATGARSIYGPILEKYEALGGPAGSDLGFPTINEVTGLAGPDSRVSTFSASDHPVIYWTSEHGAFVVRGPINAAWDKLGSSGGVLGVPVGDETYDGDVTSQKFSGGEVSWNRKSGEFTTEPQGLGDQLGDLRVEVDPAAAIAMAWRAAGGSAGPLGAKKGDQYPVGGDGIAQDFDGGKVFFTPATGANAVESEILAKYESLGGPASSDLGFPVANEKDGGLTPASRIVVFSAAGEPVIFWTPDHGAFVVRGAMKVAWDKLGGPTGELGAPVGDQTADGDIVSQKFSEGTISWDRANNTFSTDPAKLAPSLSGLQVPGQDQPSSSAAPSQAKKFTWHRWWLVAAGGAALVIVMLLLLVFRLRRRRAGKEIAGYANKYDHDARYNVTAGGDWPHVDTDVDPEPFGFDDPYPPKRSERDVGPVSRVNWPRGAAAATGSGEYAHRGGDYFSDLLPEADEEFEFEEDDADEADTTPTPVVTYADISDVLARERSISESVGTEAFGRDAYFADAAVPEGAAPDAYDVGAPFSETFFPGAEQRDAGSGAADVDTGRHSIVAPGGGYGPDEELDEAQAPAAGRGQGRAARPTIHLPLDDPYQAPSGYPIKASTRFGLYYTPGGALYHDTLAEIWFASEEAAQANGFVKAD